MSAELVELYGKPGCSLCHAAREKLDAMLGPHGYTRNNLSEFSDLHDGWRDDDSVTIKAAWAMIDGRLPVILIGRKPYTYPEAMKLLKKRLAGGVPPKGGCRG